MPMLPATYMRELVLACEMHNVAIRERQRSVAEKTKRMTVMIKKGR